MGDSSIEWTNKTWNPVTGCSKVSPGCAHCYAESYTARMAGQRGWIEEHRPWTPENAAHNVRLHPARLELPLRWREPKMIFVNSMSDLFHELVPSTFIIDVFNTMREASHHTFQILTKRPERMANMLRTWPLREHWPNVWLGTSIENRRFVGRADWLRLVPAAVRFISAEPLLGPLTDLDLAGVDWLIVGGESGKGHRRFEWDWARDLRNASAENGTAFFLKQGGGHRPGDRLEDLPEDLRIRDYPLAGGVAA